MFKFFGAFVALYVVFAVLSGQVLAKSGSGSRSVDRRDSPGYFWSVVAVYTGLSIALIFWF